MLPALDPSFHEHQATDVVESTKNRLQPIEDDDQQDTLNCIRSMLEREQTSYSISPSTKDEPFSVRVTPTYRKRVVEWGFALVEALELRRETIERATNCIDRLVLLKGGKMLLSDIVLYQRGYAMAVFLMAKCHEKGLSWLEDMVDICNGRVGHENDNISDEDLDHTAEQLAAMEIVILHELDWTINPPTCCDYFAQFLKLLGLPFSDEFDPMFEVFEDGTDDGQVGDSSTNRLLESAFAEVEQTLQDYDCAKRGAFCNAYTAFINALPMIEGGTEMADRLEASLSVALAPLLVACRSSDSCTSDAATISTTSHESFRFSFFCEEEADNLSSLDKMGSQGFSDYDATACTTKSGEESVSSESLGSVSDTVFPGETVETKITVILLGCTFGEDRVILESSWMANSDAQINQANDASTTGTAEFRGASSGVPIKASSNVHQATRRGNEIDKALAGANPTSDTNPDAGGDQFADWWESEWDVHSFGDLSQFSDCPLLATKKISDLPHLLEPCQDEIESETKEKKLEKKSKGRKERYRNSQCARAKARVRAEMEAKQKAEEGDKHGLLDEDESPSCVMDKAIPMQIQNSLVAQTSNHLLDAEWTDEVVTLCDLLN